MMIQVPYVKNLTVWHDIRTILKEIGEFQASPNFVSETKIIFNKSVSISTLLNKKSDHLNSITDVKQYQVITQDFLDALLFASSCNFETNTGDVDDFNVTPQ